MDKMKHEEHHQAWLVFLGSGLVVAKYVGICLSLLQI